MSNVYVFDPVDFANTPIAKSINRIRTTGTSPVPAFTDDDWMWIFESIEGLLDNSESSCISLKNRKRWYYLLIGHKAILQTNIDKGNSGLVGKITSATEGSVSISSEYPMGSGALEQWLKQTPYGAEFYAITLPWRSVLWFSSTRPMPVNRSRFTFWRNW